MASGPEHYREAERLLDNTEDSVNCDRMLAHAQVHATLALAAACALAGSDWKAWQDAAAAPGGAR